MFDAFIDGNCLGLLQREDGGRRNVQHLIAREETAEMQGIVGKPVADDPLTHPSNHLHIIVHTRDDKVRQFYPHTGIAHGDNGVKDGLQVATTDLHVDVVGE